MIKKIMAFDMIRVVFLLLNMYLYIFNSYFVYALFCWQSAGNATDNMYKVTSYFFQHYPNFFAIFPTLIC